MGQPKKQKSPRKTGLGRSHLVLKLARRVNGLSPVKVRTTKRETGKPAPKLNNEAPKQVVARKTPGTSINNRTSAPKTSVAK